MKQDQSKLRRKKINLMLNDEERRIITEKAIKYGYGNKLASYVRAACIYENIYVQDIKGIDKIFEVISSYISEVRKIQGCIYGIYKNSDISKRDLQIFKEQNDKIDLSIEKLKNEVDSKLNADIRKIKANQQ